MAEMIWNWCWIRPSAFALCLAAPAAYAQNLVVNPSFEVDNYTTYAGYVVEGPGSSSVYIGNNNHGFVRAGSISGWTIGNSVDVYSGPLYRQAAGNSYLDLVGGGQYSPGAFFVSQVLNTTPGQNYSLRFNYGENLSLRAGSTVNLQVSLIANAGTGSPDFASVISWMLSADATKDPRWQTASYNFTASSTQTQLRLADQSAIYAGFLPPAYTFGGATLDNFSVEASQIPEPSTGMICFLTLGSVVLYSRRRRALAP
jgi:hypothetical protein